MAVANNTYTSQVIRYTVYTVYCTLYRRLGQFHTGTFSNCICMQVVCVSPLYSVHCTVLWSNKLREKKPFKLSMYLKKCPESKVLLKIIFFQLFCITLHCGKMSLMLIFQFFLSNIVHMHIVYYAECLTIGINIYYCY